MTPEQEYEAAAETLRGHELRHVKIQREYDASLAKLKLLNRLASDAWRRMLANIEAEINSAPSP
jgi:hypothetical protein